MTLKKELRQNGFDLSFSTETYTLCFNLFWLMFVFWRVKVAVYVKLNTEVFTFYKDIELVYCKLVNYTLKPQISFVDLKKKSKETLKSNFFPIKNGCNH